MPFGSPLDVPLAHISKVLNCNSLLCYFNKCPKLCLCCQYSVLIIYVVKLVKIYYYLLLPVLIDMANKDDQISLKRHLIGSSGFAQLVRVPNTNELHTDHATCAAQIDNANFMNFKII